MPSPGTWRLFGRGHQATDHDSALVTFPRLSPAVLEQTCLCCGLPRGLWMANSGRGHLRGEHAYCCRGCAEGALCECRRQASNSPWAPPLSESE